MTSLIEGYEYDVFISYRQKDNKYDGWVTEFVNNLKRELDATFKDEISVYFDINPHDGLLETHDVDASLKEKLKCLVFVPIISRTYCDPKSFAWEHEFKAFIEQASKDQFGLKVKLPNGNVASRVLPVRIHDLDAADIKECESVLGGVLRGVEFIYKEAGIDKPLAPDDDEKKNLNNTKYRIQIIKVAHAIKEIIIGIKTEPAKVVEEKDQSKESFKGVREEKRKIDQEKPAKVGRVRFLIPTAVVALLIIAGIIAYPKIFKRNTLERLRSSGERISVAVMPFQNMTNDTTWNVWQKGTQDNLITRLSNSEELKIKQSESINTLISSKGFVNYASFTPSAASKISQKLDANIFIYGNIQKAGPFVRVNAQLIDSKTQEVYKAFQLDGLFKEETIFNIVDSLSIEIENFLILSQLKNKESIDFKKLITTKSPEAYRNFISGMDAFGIGDYSTARGCFFEAIKIDSNFIFAIMMLSRNDLSLSFFEEGKEYCLKAYKKRTHLPLYMRISVDDLYAWYTIGPQGRIKYLKQLLDLDDQDPSNYYNLANAYRLLYQWDKVIPILEKYFDIYKKWGMKPTMVFGYIHLGRAYHATGQYKKEKELYKQAEQNFPGVSSIPIRQAILSLAVGDTITANNYIKRYISLQRDNSSSEVNIITGIAGIYAEAGILDRAENYYRQALSIEPDSTARINTLAYFLIDKDRNNTQGMELVNKALELRPDNYSYLDCKGWGLCKQGKYQEAIDILQRSWDLRMKNAIYNHEAYLHLEAAKKAFAGQK